MPTKQDIVRNKLLHAIPLLVLLLLGVTFWIGWLLHWQWESSLLVQTLDAIKESTQHPVMACGAYTVALCLVVATGVPMTLPLTVTGGAVLGVPLAVILGAIAEIVGNLILFAALCLVTTSKPPPEGFHAKWQHRFTRHPFWYSLAIRFAPMVPGGGTTLALAWLRCPMWIFLASTAIVSLESLAIETTLGDGLHTTLQNTGLRWSSLSNPHLLVPLVLLATPGTLVTFYTAHKIRKQGFFSKDH